MSIFAIENRPRLTLILVSIFGILLSGFGALVIVMMFGISAHYHGVQIATVAIGGAMISLTLAPVALFVMVLAKKAARFSWFAKLNYFFAILSGGFGTVLLIADGGDWFIYLPLVLLGACLAFVAKNTHTYEGEAT